jgi:hypothetical protein
MNGLLIVYSLGIMPLEVLTIMNIYFLPQFKWPFQLDHQRGMQEGLTFLFLVSFFFSFFYPCNTLIKISQRPETFKPTYFNTQVGLSSSGFWGYDGIIKVSSEFKIRESLSRPQENPFSSHSFSA